MGFKILVISASIEDYLTIAKSVVNWELTRRRNISEIQVWGADVLNYLGFHSWRWSYLLTEIDQAHPWKDGDKEFYPEERLLQITKAKAIQRAKNWGNTRGHFRPTGEEEQDIATLKSLILWRKHPKNPNLWCYTKKTTGACSQGRTKRRDHCINLLKMGNKICYEVSMKKWDVIEDIQGF